MKADAKEIEHDLLEYDQYNKQYALMKAKMVRQGIITADYNKKLEVEEQAAAVDQPLQR